MASAGIINQFIETHSLHLSGLKKKIVCVICHYAYIVSRGFATGDER
jgi:hypothetical protein